MEVIKNKDNYLLKNDDGEYHISHKQFDSIGEDAAIKLAESEIKIKLTSTHKGKTINFAQARGLGFCEEGIEDFCKELNLDIDAEYSIEELNKGLTLDILTKYTDECLKLFGADSIKYLGGIKGVLNKDTISLVLREEFISKNTLFLLGCKFAREVLSNFEDKHPDDDRPRKAIEAREAWVKGDITDEQLSAARSAAYSAAYSATDSAARSAAYSATDSAARSAADSAALSATYSATDSATDSAARSAARSAAYSAADSAARSATYSAALSATCGKQVLMILEALDNNQ